MWKLFQPEYSSFPLNSDEYKEVKLVSTKETLENDIKDAVCICLTKKDWKTVVNKVVKK